MKTNSGSSSEGSTEPEEIQRTTIGDILDLKNKMDTANLPTRNLAWKMNKHEYKILRAHAKEVYGWDLPEEITSMKVYGFEVTVT